MKTKCKIMVLFMIFFSLISSVIYAKESNKAKTLVSSIKFKTLNTGQGVCTGSIFEIEWQGINASDTVVIQYSTNGGSNWIMITDTATGLKYSWKVPNTPSTNCLAIVTEKHPKCTQEWITKNLEVTTYRNGDPIPEITDPTQWANLKTGAWCYYNNDPTMGAKYGKLYNWYAVNDPRGLAPIGLHISSDNDWTELENCLGGSTVAGGKLKDTGTVFWITPNSGATNESSFSALPGGYRDENGTFRSIGESGDWWSSMEFNIIKGLYRYLHYANIEVTRQIYNKEAGFSVRCLKGELPPLLPKIDSIKPDKAFVGDEVILYGSNFGASQGLSKVNFSGTLAILYKGWSDSQIRTVIPSGGTTGKVSVSVNSTKSNEVDFTLIADTVKICNQVWKTRNLDVDHYRNGDSIPEVRDPSAWINLTTGAWCYYNNDSLVGKTYGKLYNWYAVNDLRGLAPLGWHISTESDWTELSYCLGGSSVAGGKLKTNGTIEGGNGLWVKPNIGATNESQFSALPGGYRHSLGMFNYIGNDCDLWTTSKIDLITARGINLNYSVQSINLIDDGKDHGFSVRCVKDFPSPKLDSIKPDKAFVGDEIKLYGSNFGASQGLSKVNFSGIEAIQYKSWSDSEIRTVIPSGGKTGKVSVSVNSINSNELNFTVVDTVKICNQVWMLRNLDVDHYRNGDPIPEVQDTAEWGNLTTGAWTYYNNDPTMVKIYGKLYNWYAVNDSRGIAPEGWHVPTDGEWTELTDCLGGETIAGGKLKETGTTHWLSPNEGATNSSDFSALPGGYRAVDGTSDPIGYIGYWWSSTNIGGANAWIRSLRSINANVARYYCYMKSGFSVRCVKDFPSPKLDSIKPDKAFVADEVILYGSNFGATQGTSKVSFTSSDAKDYPSWSDSLIKVLIPTGGTTGKVSVSVSSIKSNEVDFTLIADTIKICNQVWTTKNLDVDHYRNGDSIPEVRDGTEWANLKTGAWCYYNNDSALGATYGKLYNWYAVNDPRGLAPIGWHIPSDSGWKVMEMCLGMTQSDADNNSLRGTDEGGKLKRTGTIEEKDGLWNSPNIGATNQSKFSALPSGYRNNFGTFNYLGSNCYWWTSTDFGASRGAWFRHLSYVDARCDRTEDYKVNGFSVRLVKD